MKRCPECRRDYYDDTLLYWLDDGNVLLEGPVGEVSFDSIVRHDDPRFKELVKRVGPSE